jgi:predicted dehydrogenase
MSNPQKTYTVAIAGLGKRGNHHAEAFSQNPRFEIVGLCDIDQERMEAAGQRFGVSYTNSGVAQMLADTKPDVFVFCTLPAIRLEFIRAGIDAGVQLIAYEKPIATTTNEAL